MSPCVLPISWAGRLLFLLGRRDRNIPLVTTVWRRLFHAGAGCSLAVFVAVAPAHSVLPGVAALAGVAVALELARLRAVRLNRVLVRWLAPLLKREEDRRITGATYTVVAALAAYLLFDPAVATAALVFLALGDPAAALLGQRVRRPRVWGKSPVGTLAFFTVSLLAAGALVWLGWSDGHWALAAGAAAAALAELLPLPMDDNLSVPLVCGAVMQLARLG